jgi:hypothetical protein
MATGPIAGGLIYDTFASYAWLYIGAWGMGLGAFLMALSFRPFPKVRANGSAAAPAAMAAVARNSRCAAKRPAGAASGN